MLKDLLEEKQCFKLVCGAGNEDAIEVEKLTYIYSLAGCPFFDVCAKKEIVEAAKRGIEKSGITKDRYICTSVGIAGDPHITKANIDSKKCSNCGLCFSNCVHEAIDINPTKIIKERCLGCAVCEKICPNNAISMVTTIQDYKEILPPIIQMGIDCIEFHAITDDEIEVFEKWEEINKMFDGILCISIDRSKTGDIKLKERVQKLLEKRAPYTTIIQADGIAMSGNNDEFGTTLQSVATAQLFQNSKLPIYIMMSGGTNTKSTQLAKQCGIQPNCIAIGSYARKIVNNYLKMDDLLENNKALNEAVKIASELVKTSLDNMK